MDNKYLNKLIGNKEKELLELREVKAYLEEVERLNRIKVYVTVVNDITLMHYKDSVVTIYGKDERGTAEYIIDYFQQAINGTDVYILGYEESGTRGKIIGDIIASNKNFSVFKMREVKA